MLFWQKYLCSFLIIMALVFSCSNSAAAAETFSLRRLVNEDIDVSDSQYSQNLAADLKNFSNRAAKLQRLCEGAFRRGSYLDKLSRPGQLRNHNQLRSAYRFWKLFRLFLNDLNLISEKYEMPMVINHSEKVKTFFAGYSLGIAARLCQVICVSDLMNFLAARGDLENVLNESNSEFDLPEKSLSTAVKRSLHPETLAQLYRFRISHYEEAVSNPPVVVDQFVFQQVSRYIHANRSFLDNLTRKVAGDPSWKFLSRSIINFTLDFILPAQKSIFTWVGDTRIKQQHSRLISQKQLQSFGEMLKPGDIILGRQDWFLSNVFLPGFWPHAILYIGTPEEIKASLDKDPEVNRWCRKYNVKSFADLLQKEFPDAGRAWLAACPSDSLPCRMLEAISDGVVFNSLPGSLHCDYLAAMRPRLKPLAIAKAIFNAFSYFGREYDFQFSFSTEQSLVCTELVTKAYSRSDNDGLRFPMVKSLGKFGIPADSMVKTFATERGKPGQQLDFVAFLRGLPAKKTAVFADEKTFAGSYRWDGGLKSDNTR